MSHTILSILHPEMQQVSQPVLNFDAQLQQDINTLRAAMLQHQESAIAAIQVGIPRQIVLIDITDEKAVRQQLTLVNPVILSMSAETATFTEQCPSLPGEMVQTQRAVQVRVSFQDPQGQQHQLDAQGYLAVYLQHTLDHLRGVSPATYLSPLKYQRLLTRLRKRSKQA